MAKGKKTKEEVEEPTEDSPLGEADGQAVIQQLVENNQQLQATTQNAFAELCGSLLSL